MLGHYLGYKELPLESTGLNQEAVMSDSQLIVHPRVWGQAIWLEGVGLPGWNE